MVRSVAASLRSGKVLLAISALDTLEAVLGVLDTVSDVERAVGGVGWRGAGRSRGERTRSRTLVTRAFIYIARANQRNRDKHFCRVFAHGPPSLPSCHSPLSRCV